MDMGGFSLLLFSKHVFKFISLLCCSLCFCEVFFNSNQVGYSCFVLLKVFFNFVLESCQVLIHFHEVI